MAYVGIEIGQSPNYPLVRELGAQLHLTLWHFEKPQRAQSFELARLLGKLPSLELPPAIWTTGLEHWDRVGDVLLVEPKAGLLHLRAEIHQALMHVNIEPTVRDPYRPHITLGSSTPFISAHPQLLVVPQALELAGTPVIVRYRFPFHELGINSP